MSSPISRVMRSAIDVLPLPGKPNRKMDAAELIAGPISLNTSGVMTRSSNAFWIERRVTTRLRIVWAMTLST